MSSSRSNDKSLLDRLNALKTSSVTLDHTPNTASFSAVSPQNQPVSREDVLAERLRQLRQGNTGPNLPRPGDRSSENGPVLGSSGNVGVDEPPSPLPTQTAQPPATPRISTNRDPKEQLVNSLPSTPSSLPRTVSKAENAGKSGSSYFAGGLEDVDDDAVQALLEDLGGEDFDLTDALNEGADTKTEDQKVEELLSRLSKAVPPSSGNEQSTDCKDDEDDNSDGEHMTAAVDKILSQTQDELTLSKSTDPEENNGQGNPGNNINSRKLEQAPTKAPSKSNDGNSPPLELPTVPSALADPAPDTFIDEISSRLAALRGIGPVDSFGLPAAPTFAPEERLTPAKKPPLGGREEKYSDDDVKTWCIVCLDDGTIKCIGCDDDLYCDRCWREMHVGPRAGYDERGHQWVKYNSRRAFSFE
ncbi:hypothetical protein QBC40DRAFT_221314 [Triangularia verruculosa]|uniref:Abscission/NoCut checkpoint regulator n=1 Tax=Triangularia verruculosa TaxID=2587418 RepID=A0AAN6XLD5_9PEZI|nr:hypothetical protein QBC40DRAFT_221314 [Triangularia verruculosa]